ncbi:MAG: DNA-binding protein [Bacteroidetes bacterium]|nr:MAG: DNA-binding protein [Bacteroidota bacterium]
MKIRLKFIVLITGIIAIVLSCASNKDSKDSNLAPNAHKVIAEEIIQGNNYTYVRVSADGKDYWIAIEKAEVKEGETYYWSLGAEMNEFTSKELKRTFRSIFFVQDFTDKPITTTPAPKQIPLTSMAGKQQAPEYPGIVVPKAPGGITIAEFYAGKNSIAGKTVKICGKVVKFSAGIMKKNWVHIQDGTKDAGKFDLTVTTQDSVKVGDVVIFEGVAAFNKDVGAGYFYEILLEDAKVKK